MESIKRFIEQDKYLPQWCILLSDLLLCSFSLFVSYLLRFNFDIPAVEHQTFFYVFPAVLIIRSLFFIFFRTYRSVIRYTSTRDAQRVFLSIVLGAIALSVLNPISRLISGVYLAPFSIIIIDGVLSVFLLISYRVAVRLFVNEIKNPNKEKESIIIFGAGEAGLIAKRAIDRDASVRYKVKAFIDDNPSMKGKKIEGVYVHHSKDLLSLLQSKPIKLLIIAIQNLSSTRMAEIVDLTMPFKTKVLNVPPVANWINGNLSFKQIKKVRIEELLNRIPIELDHKRIKSQIAGKVVLVTGAAGSIGSELVRQLCFFKPSKLIMLDYAETPLHELELEMLGQNYNFCEAVIADVRNADRMQKVFEYFNPLVVYHVAAYKHVPMMELNPSEAIYTNVHGTRTVADLAHKYSTEAFVFVSTDKAVNPTNIMGASKRIAEMYIQALSQKKGPKYITTRFGNVLGSNGSVIPLFRRQLDEGKPLTVTHPEVTRYFMTIPEACQLVMEAGSMGEGGEVYLFDMGESVKISDLATKMIQISGLELGKDAQIVYTGLRPGEKLYEELLTANEKSIPTHHPKIMIAKIEDVSFEYISSEIDKLMTFFETQDNTNIVKQMKTIVPEFTSNNSEFEKLDH